MNSPTGSQPNSANSPFASPTSTGGGPFGPDQRTTQPLPPASGSQPNSGCGCWIIGLLVAGVVMVFMVILAVGAVGFFVVSHRPVVTPPPPSATGNPFGMPNPRVPLPQNSAAPAPSPVPLQPLPDPVAPEQPLPPITATLDDVVPLGVLIHRDTKTFEERAPEGGVLVGLRLVKGTNWGGTLCGIQAIYQIGDRYQLGGAFGPGGGVAQSEFLAKPGYAIGKIETRVGASLNAVKITFRRVSDRKLLLDDSYESDWYGCDGGSAQPAMDGQDDLLAGIRGTFHSDLHHLAAYRLLLIDPPTQPLSAAPATKPGERVQAGGIAGEMFSEDVPDGAWLVGFRVRTGSNWGGALQAVQPIYQLNREYRLGKLHGPPGGSASQLVAPPGYVVAKIEAEAGLVFNGFQLTWHRLRDDGTLDPADAKTSSFVGVRGGRPVVLDTQGRPIRSIFGYYKDDMMQMGLALGERP